MAGFDPNHLKAAKQFSRREILFCLARVPNSSRAYVGASDFTVARIDLGKDKLEPEVLGKHGSYVTGVALAGGVLVSGGYDRKLIWWDVEKGTQVRAVDAHARWIRDVVASPDGKVVASVADDMVCKLWDAGSGKLLRELHGHEEMTPNHFRSMLFTCAFSPDGKHLATADKVGHIVVWEVGTGKQVATVEAPVMYTWDPRQRIHSIGGVRSLAFSPDGKLLAAGGIGKIGNIDHLGGKARVEVFDWRAGKRTHEYPGDKFNGLVERLAFHPDGKWLAAAGGDNGGFVMFFDLGQKKPVVQEKAPMHVHDFAVDEQWKTLYAVGHGRAVVYRLG
jgi:WD40 repeat protein